MSESPLKGNTSCIKVAAAAGVGKVATIAETAAAAVVAQSKAPCKVQVQADQQQFGGRGK